MLAFDIETYTDETAIPLLPTPEAPGNIKDPAKIAAAIAEKTIVRNSRLALDPDCCRVVAVGWSMDGDVRVCICPDVATERDALGEFWQTFDTPESSPVVGYNCIGFDLPVLIQRSRILGVEHPQIQVKKYGTAGVLDMMMDLSFGGMHDFKRLGFWCQRFGLDVPQDETTGGDIEQLVFSGDWKAVANHCRIDVLKTWALAQKLYRKGRC